MSNRYLRVSVLALSMTAVVATNPVSAELCTIDQVPAATLLVPHFQVDLDAWCGAPGSGAGVTTLFTIRNTRAEPVLTQVNLWSDVDLPVGGFPVYLDGYDTQAINLADVLCNGAVPMTGTQFFEGSLSAPQETFPLCQNGGLLEIPTLSPAFVAHLQASLTGQPSPLTGAFSGIDFGDNIARGYVTVDTIEVCDSTMPSDPGYFFGKATNENVLLGDYQIVHPANNFAFGETAVAVEAAEVPFFLPGDMTFYGRYVGETGQDQREPLPTTFLVPRTDGGLADNQTQLIVWREGSNRTFGGGPCPFSCEPNFPLGANQVTQLTADGEPLFPPPPFPGEPLPNPVVPGLASELIQNTAILGDQPAATDNGSIYLNLQTFMSGRLSVGQAWVVAVDSSEGRFQTGNDAVALDSGCPSGTTVTADAQGALISNPAATGPVVFPEIFKNGFEGN